MRNRIVLALSLLSFVVLPVAAREATDRVDRAAFYVACTKAFPPRLFEGEARKTFDGIFDYWDASPYTDRRWLAYILATAYRESARTMLPVREGVCPTDQCSIDAVARLKKNSRDPSINYALPDANGRSYFGRGLVQLTHKDKYRRAGQALGWDLVEKPDLALERDKAIAILIEGMAQGFFSKRNDGTRRKLSDYFNDRNEDWIGARKIVNPGSSRAHIPAAHAQRILPCLAPTAPAS
jgi:hypothetical protein